jgi:hypothetical protein
MYLRILRDVARGVADRALWGKLRNRLSNETLSALLCLQFNVSEPCFDFKPTKEMVEKCGNAISSLSTVTVYIALCYCNPFINYAKILSGWWCGGASNTHLDSLGYLKGQISGFFIIVLG